MVRWIASIFVSSILALMIAIAAIFLYNAYLDEQNNLQLIEQTIRNSYDINIKSQVDNVITLLEGVYKKYESGELTFAESQALGADLVRDLRYDDDGYFWIDTTEGINVVLLGSSTEGTNRYNFRDPRGTPILKQFIEIALDSGSGYQDYWFPKANQTEPLMKRGYVKLFKPFNWVVGTGNYIDDINKTIDDKRQEISTAFRNQILSISLLFLIIAFCTIFLVYLLSKSITTPLLKTANLANLISNGVLDQDIDCNILRRKDEVGQLAVSIEKMKNSIKGLIARLTEKAKTLELETEFMEIKKHPEIGYHILKSVDVYSRLSEYVLSHHERWDGHGYPRGISGNKIPLVSRIITVADAYEAMTSHRLYRNSFSQKQAVEELKRYSGTQFDPEIVAALEKVCLLNESR